MKEVYIQNEDKSSIVCRQPVIVSEFLLLGFTDGFQFVIYLNISLN